MFFGEIKARVKFEARKLDGFGEEVDDFFAFHRLNKTGMLASLFKLANPISNRSITQAKLLSHILHRLVFDTAFKR